MSPYYQEYQNWKGEEVKQCTFEDTYVSAINLVNRHNQKG